MIRAVLFDAAGTLIEPVEPVGETYARHAAEFGLVISAWRLGDAFARTFHQIPLPVAPHSDAPERRDVERAWWKDLVRRTFLAADSAKHPEDLDALFEALWSAYSTPSHWRVRAGAAALLAALRERGLATAVVSNFDSRLRELLAGLGLSPALDAVVLASDAGAAKPAPEIFGFALAQLGVRPSEAVFVGDDPERDLAGARAVGMHAVDAGSLATLAELQLPDAQP